MNFYLVLMKIYEHFKKLWRRCCSCCCCCCFYSLSVLFLVSLYHTAFLLIILILIHLFPSNVCNICCYCCCLLLLLSVIKSVWFIFFHKFRNSYRITHTYSFSIVSYSCVHKKYALLRRRNDKQAARAGRLMVISFLQRRFHPVTRCIKKLLTSSVIM